MSLRARRRPAFTMIEVMVTLGIAVLISGLTYQILTSSSKINRKVEGKTEAIQSANLACETIKRDLRQLVTRPFIVKPDGTFTGIVGDAQHPVLISQNGTEMSFHVPDPTSPTPDPTSGKYKLATVYYGLYKVAVKDGGLETTVFHLVRAEGANPDLAAEASAKAGLGKANVSAIYLMPGKDGQGNPVAPIQFKLLGPNPNLGAGSPSEASPDNNYYVEVKLFGSDGQAQEQQPRNDLTVLDEPSRLAQVPALRVNEFTLFQGDPPPLFIANLPPNITDQPVNLAQNPKPGTNPNDPNAPPVNPAIPNPNTPNPNAPDPNNPNPNPNTPPNPNPNTTPNPPVTTNPNPPPVAPPSTPPPNTGLPPGVDPKGPKSWSTYIAKDSAGNPTLVVTAVLLNDGTLKFTKKDGSGKVLDEVLQERTPQGAGQNAAAASVDAWLLSSGIDPKSVRNDPGIQPPPDYTAN